MRQLALWPNSIWLICWLVTYFHRRKKKKVAFILAEFKLVLSHSFSEKARTVAIPQKQQGCFICGQRCKYLLYDLQKTVQANPRVTNSPVLQPLFFHLQCCRFILFEQIPWVNFLFASVCVLFVADTVPGQQL